MTLMQGIGLISGLQFLIRKSIKTISKVNATRVELLILARVTPPEIIITTLMQKSLISITVSVILFVLLGRTICPARKK